MAVRGKQHLAGREEPVAPKQKSLDGMQDRAIDELEDLAVEYAQKRDARMAVGKEEVQLKEKILSIMDKGKREKYVHEAVEITVIAEKRKVRVKIHKDEKDEAAD